MNFPAINKNLAKIKFGLLAAVGILLFFNFYLAPARGQQTSDPVVMKDENYRIGPGDVIDIVVSKNDTLSRAGVRVNNQGMIQLPMIDGDVSAACRTERELADQIREKYKKYLLYPYVIVAVKEFNSTPVTLLGEVVTPKQFQLQRPMRLLEVLTSGNGVTAKAGQTVQVISNPEAHNCQQEKIAAPETADTITSYQLANVLKGDEQANPFIQPGDVVRVTEAHDVQAYIIGNVQKAMTIDLKEPVTLTQAFAMAGGPSQGAQLDKVKISRQVPGSTDKTQMVVNLKEINKTNQGDFYLKSNDIIDVPGPSGGKKFLKDLLKTVVPAVTRVGVPIP